MGFISSFEIDKNNSINFNLRRNNEKSATEFYNLIYNYKNDCLVASVKFNKEFYKDSDLKPEKEISRHLGTDAIVQTLKQTHYTTTIHRHVLAD